MRVFPVKLPSGARYWTVLDESLMVVPAADAFLRHVRFGAGRLGADDAGLCGWDRVVSAVVCPFWS